MLLGSITSFINCDLRSKWNFSDRYFTNIDNENNKININLLVNTHETGLFVLVRTNIEVLKDLHINILKIIQLYDQNVVNIKISANISDGNFIGFTILLIRNDQLINLLEMLPKEIIQLISYKINYKFNYKIKYRDIDNFRTTCKKYRESLYDDIFWSTNFMNEYNVSPNKINDIQFYINSSFTYEKLCRYTYHNNIELLIPSKYKYNNYYNIIDNIECIKCLLKLNLYTLTQIKSFFQMIIHPYLDPWENPSNWIIVDRILMFYDLGNRLNVPKFKQALMTNNGSSASFLTRFNTK